MLKKMLISIFFIFSTKLQYPDVSYIYNGVGNCLNFVIFAAFVVKNGHFWKFRLNIIAVSFEAMTS